MAGKLKAPATRVQSRSKLRVGDRVRFGKAPSRWSAVVIEDRGKLGVGGRRIWRVRTLSKSPGAAFETEIPEDELTKVA